MRLVRVFPLALAAVLSACGPEPEPPPRPVPPRPAAPPPQAPPTLEERMKRLEGAEKAEPGRFLAHHEAWSAIRAEARGTRHEAAVAEKLDRLEGAANKAYRELYRPVQDEIRRLAGERRPLEARERLLAWKVPPEMDIGGLLSADLTRQLAVLNDLALLEERRRRLHEAVHAGDASRDPAAELGAFVDSPRVAVRAEAERSILELRRLRAAESRRRRIAAAAPEGPAVFGERPGARVPTEGRFEERIPAAARASLEASRGLLPRLPGDVLLVFLSEPHAWHKPDGVAVRWSTVDGGKTVSPDRCPTPPLALPAMHAELHRTADYPEATETFRKRGHEQPYLLSRLQASRIGGAPFFIQHDERRKGETILCLLSSYQPGTTGPRESRELARAGYAEVGPALMIGDVGCLYFVVDGKGRVRWFEQCY